MKDRLTLATLLGTKGTSTLTASAFDDSSAAIAAARWCYTRLLMRNIIDCSDLVIFCRHLGATWA